MQAVGLVISLALGVAVVRLGLPALFARTTRRWMNQRRSQVGSFPEPAARAPGSAEISVDRILAIASRSRWIALAAVAAVVVSTVVIHLGVVEPNPDPTRSNLTVGAVLLDCIFTLPFFLFALRLPAHPVSWWVSSLIPGLFLGMGFWVTASTLSDGILFAAAHLLGVVIATWVGTILLLSALRAVAFLAGQSSLTSGLTQAAAFGLAGFSFYIWNAIRGPGALLLLAPVAIVGVLLSLVLPRHGGAPQSILLLRTFGSSRRSRRLMDQLVRHWLSVGPVFAVQGPDLASTTLEVRHLAGMLMGRSRRRYVETPIDVERAWSRGMTLHRDGRYSLESLYCLDDTWKPTVERLVAQVDYVVMDARGFSAGNAGFTFELGAVVRRRASEGVVFLVDAKTDAAFLEATLAAAGWVEGVQTCIVRSDVNERADVVALLRVLAGRQWTVNSSPEARTAAS